LLFPLPLFSFFPSLILFTYLVLAFWIIVLFGVSVFLHFFLCPSLLNPYTTPCYMSPEAMYLKRIHWLLNNLMCIDFNAYLVGRLTESCLLVLNICVCESIICCFVY